MNLVIVMLLVVLTVLALYIAFFKKGGSGDALEQKLDEKLMLLKAELQQEQQRNKLDLKTELNNMETSTRVELNNMAADTRAELNNMAKSTKEELNSFAAGTKAELNSMTANTTESVKTLSSFLAQTQEKTGNAQSERLTAMEKSILELRQENTSKLLEIQASVKDKLAENENNVREQIRIFQDAQKGIMEEFRLGTNNQLNSMVERVEALEKTSEAKLEKLSATIESSMEKIRKENTEKLNEIKGTVDEQLQTTLEKRINESFRTVSEELKKVYEGLGEMKNLAQDVGGLKKVLSNVKTRGILGEVQLKAILEEILNKDQYAENVATVTGSNDKVEFAIKLPGTDDKPVYLPIDSKFPGERYAKLQEAKENGDKTQIKNAYKELEGVLISEAKDIHTKYISVPDTTEFAVMFLPFEGLYAEAVNMGLMEKLAKDYKVNIAGPSTMAAFLNSLQMGFKTLAIQKRSSEVWQILGAVKTAFASYEKDLNTLKKHLDNGSNTLDHLLTTRTKSVNRSLRKVEALDAEQSEKLLALTGESMIE